MLSVEDVLEALAELVEDSLYSFGSVPDPNISFNKWDQEFIIDMATHVKDRKQISTAQGAIVVKLIGRHRDLLERKGLPKESIDQLLLAPIYRLTPYTSTVLPREVRWCGGNTLAFRCKYNQNVIDAIKRLRHSNPIGIGTGAPFFLQSAKLWIVTVTDDNLEQVMQVIQRHKFAFDGDVEQMFLRMANTPLSRGSISVEDGQLVVEASNDHFMHAWTRGVLRLDGQDV